MEDGPRSATRPVADRAGNVLGQLSRPCVWLEGPGWRPCRPVDSAVITQLRARHCAPRKVWAGDPSFDRPSPQEADFLGAPGRRSEGSVAGKLPTVGGGERIRARLRALTSRDVVAWGGRVRRCAEPLGLARRHGGPLGAPARETFPLMAAVPQPAWL